MTTRSRPGPGPPSDLARSAHGDGLHRGDAEHAEKETRKDSCLGFGPCIPTQGFDRSILPRLQVGLPPEPSSGSRAARMGCTAGARATIRSACSPPAPQGFGRLAHRCGPRTPSHGLRSLVRIAHFVLRIAQSGTERRFFFWALRFRHGMFEIYCAQSTDYAQPEVRHVPEGTPACPRHGPACPRQCECRSAKSEGRIGTAEAALNSHVSNPQPRASAA